MERDFFETPESIPEYVANIIDSYTDDEWRCSSTKNFRLLSTNLNAIGWSVDIDADFSLIELRKI